MKISIPIGRLKVDDRFQTIHSHRKGVVVRRVDLAGNGNGVYVYMQGLGRRKIHADVLVYVDSYGE